VADIEVLVLGGAGVDTIVYVPALPLPFADGYLVPRIVRRAGHTGDGVAVGLRALGLRTALVDLLGDDPDGDQVRALHERFGVTFHPVPTTAGTRRAVNLVDPAGRRLSLYDSTRSDADDRLPADLVASLAATARHAHVSTTYPCQHALAHLDGVTVSTDLHDWDGRNPYHEEFAFRADLVFLSGTALDDREATMRRILRGGRARAVVVTAGADGSYLRTTDDAAARWFPAAPPPGPVIDSNGAGDAFVAGFLYGHLAGEPIGTCMRYGAVAGAQACVVPATDVAPIGPDALRERIARWPEPATGGGRW
jgi:sugar/nucleoside kinase (ribokinase family)